MALPFDERITSGDGSPLAQPTEAGGLAPRNRFCILPMEGWDGTPDGRPSDLTRRRWGSFGRSGAALIWGGEAFAVRHDGRANPNQLALGPHAEADLVSLRTHLVEEHARATGRTDGLVIGLQLTHSGRYARPNPGGRWEPITAYAHPVLDRRFPAGTPVRTFSDAELDALVGDFVRAAIVARAAGFDFVDVKHCHGYLGHELLSAWDRPGPYGGATGRTMFLRRIVEGIRRDAPGLAIGVRVSAFDAVPFRKDARGVGTPEADMASYRNAFGLLADPAAAPDLEPARAFLRELEGLGIRWVSLSAGSPYYNPHIQRPALFPPSDGYLPPEDPLVGVRPADRGGRRAQARLPEPAAGRDRLLLPAGVAAARRPGRGARGADRLRRPRPDGPVLSGAADRRARRQAADPRRHLPHLQRLHQRTAQRPGLGLLPAGPVLQGASGRGAAQGDQGRHAGMSAERSRGQTLAAVTAFVSLFAIVGLALYGLPFFYDFMVKEFGWTRAQVTSGNAYSKLIVGPLFGFFAGWFVDSSARAG